MKKLTLASLVLNLVAVVLPIVSIVLYFVQYDDLPLDYSTLIGLVFVGVITSIVSVVFLKLFDGKLRILHIIPVLLNYVGFSMIMSTISNAPTNSNTVLGLLVITLYVVALVFALSKNAKWASIVVITINCLFITLGMPLAFGNMITADVDKLIISFVALYYVLTFVAQIVFFSSNLLVNKETTKADLENEETKED